VRRTIDHNFGTSLGGGVESDGTTSLDRVLIEHNRAATGGGVFVEAGTVTATHSVIRANTPDNCSPAGSVPGCVG
jgi:hypothetical protein